MHTHAAAAAAIVLAACNPVVWQESRLEHRMTQAGLQTALLDVGDAQIQYWRGGRGPAVLLLHGFGGDARWQWSGLANELTRDHSVIAPDLLWFGGSASTRDDFTVKHQADAITELLDALGIDCATIVGSSYGGFVALRMLQDHPESIARIVVIDSPGPQFDPAEVGKLERRFQVSTLDEFFVPRNGGELRRLLEASYADPPLIPTFLLPSIVREIYGSHEAEKRMLIENLPSSLQAIELGRSEAPALVVWGREDHIFPYRLGEELADRLDARLAIIDGVGHVPQLEQPEKFEASIEAFLASTTPTCSSERTSWDGPRSARGYHSAHDENAPRDLHRLGTAHTDRIDRS